MYSQYAKPQNPFLTGQNIAGTRLQMACYVISHWHNYLQTQSYESEQGILDPLHIYSTQQNLPGDTLYLAAKKNAGSGVHKVMTAGMLALGNHFNAQL